MRDDFDFRFAGPGRYGDNFYNQFYLDENRLYHREDGPAIIDSEGNKMWFWRDKQHRDGDLPAVELKDGTLGWFHHGKQHRETGPAVIYPDGREEWWMNGFRLDDDAIAVQKRLLLQKEWAEQAKDIEKGFHSGLDHTVTPLKPRTVTPRLS
jgi:hypothetical protein